MFYIVFVFRFAKGIENRLRAIEHAFLLCHKVRVSSNGDKYILKVTRSNLQNRESHGTQVVNYLLPIVENETNVVLRKDFVTIDFLLHFVVLSFVPRLAHIELEREVTVIGEYVFLDPFVAFTKTRVRPSAYENDFRFFRIRDQTYQVAYRFVR